MKTAVVILNWNGAEMLRRYLPSVLEYSPCSNTEVVVADNGSTDDSLEYLNSQAVRIIRFDNNLGFAEGYNQAIRQLEAEYVVLLNSDVEVTPGWIESLVTFMDEHPEVAAVQPKVLSWLSLQEQREGKRADVLFEHAGAAGGMMDRWGYPYCRGRMMSYTEADNGQYDTVAQVFWTTGACMLIRRQVYIDVGGLDKDFFAHQEEIDLCWRMQCRGYKLMVVPQSVVYHLGGGALSYTSPRKTYLNFRNNLLLLYKNLPACRMHGVLFARFFMDYAAVCQMLLTGQMQNAKAVIQARWHFGQLRSQYRAKRKENMRLATVPYPDTITQRSIVWDYYISHKRK